MREREIESERKIARERERKTKRETRDETKQEKEERKKEMFYLTTHSTHLIYGYMVSGIIMVNDHSDSERGNPLPPHGIPFPTSSKGSFICIIPQTG